MQNIKIPNNMIKIINNKKYISLENMRIVAENLGLCDSIYFNDLFNVDFYYRSEFIGNKEYFYLKDFKDECRYWQNPD